MAMKNRSRPIFLNLSLLVFCFSVLSPALAIAPGTDDGYTINGRVKIPKDEFTLLPLQKKHKHFYNSVLSRQMLTPSDTTHCMLLYTFWLQVLVQKDYSFQENCQMLRSSLMAARGSHSSSLMDIFHLVLLNLYAQSHNVPAGTHLIEVTAIGYFFSPVSFLLFVCCYFFCWIVIC
ncbi:hypothetical protein RHMOL_Rhmol02G0253800 [Rhododendron molle]|uniref:Uncharacterized protein n=1 Tax=Rhododendron molle TaxID=49168 RepID=A0ACC0PVD0_RHOML|nr:hypothetical protein RHMOL_Rhmol02G0253800 [Rhododendron molle]